MGVLAPPGRAVMLFQQTGSVLYVDWDNGSNCSGTGTSSDPWKTISWAVKQAAEDAMAYPVPVTIHVRPTANPTQPGGTYQQNTAGLCPPAMADCSDYDLGEYFPIVVPPHFTLTNDPAVQGMPTIDLHDWGPTWSPTIDVKEGFLLGQTSGACGGTPASLGPYGSDTVLENLVIVNTDPSNPGGDSDDDDGHGILLAPLSDGSPTMDFAPVIRNCIIRTVEGDGIRAVGPPGVALSPRIENCTIEDPALDVPNGGGLAHHIRILGQGSTGSPRIIGNTLLILDPKIAGGGCPQPEMGAGIGVSAGSDGSGTVSRLTPVIQQNTILGLVTAISCPGPGSAKIIGSREGIYLGAYEGGVITNALLEGNHIEKIKYNGIGIHAFENGSVSATIRGIPGVIPAPEIREIGFNPPLPGCVTYKSGTKDSGNFHPKLWNFGGGVALNAGGTLFTVQNGQNVTKDGGAGTIDVTIGGDLVIRDTRSFGIWARADHGNPASAYVGSCTIRGSISRVLATRSSPPFSDPLCALSLPACQDPSGTGEATDCYVPAGLSFESVGWSGSTGPDTIDMTVSDVIAADWCRGIDVRNGCGNLALLLTNNTMVNATLEGLTNGHVQNGSIQAFNNVLWNNNSGLNPDFTGIPPGGSFQFNTVECFPAPGSCGNPGQYGNEWKNDSGNPSLDATFHLTYPGSQVVDQGDDFAPGMPAYDIDGDDRIINKIPPQNDTDVDRGADEVP